MTNFIMRVLSGTCVMYALIQYVEIVTRGTDAQTTWLLHALFVAVFITFALSCREMK
jgi:hypothetical protein